MKIYLSHHFAFCCMTRFARNAVTWLLALELFISNHNKSRHHFSPESEVYRRKDLQVVSYLPYPCTFRHNEFKAIELI